MREFPEGMVQLKRAQLSNIATARMKSEYPMIYHGMEEPEIYIGEGVGDWRVVVSDRAFKNRERGVVIYIDKESTDIIRSEISE